MCLRGGKEKGFTSLEDYAVKRHIYIKNLRNLRKEKERRLGERGNAGITARSSLRKLMPAIGIAVVFVVAIWLLVSGWWLKPFVPDDPNRQKIFAVPTATPAPTATPDPSKPQVSDVVITRAPRKPIPWHIYAPAGIGVLFLLLAWRSFASKRAASRKAAAAAAIRKEIAEAYRELGLEPPSSTK